jgi:acetolactate synthase-1/2/3 large subunit
VAGQRTVGLPLLHDEQPAGGRVIGGLIERKLVMQADLIVAVGLDAVEPQPYQLPVLSLASVPSLDALVPADPEIIGDLEALLVALAQWAPEGRSCGQVFPPGRKKATAFRSS